MARAPSVMAHLNTNGFYPSSQEAGSDDDSQPSTGYVQGSQRALLVFSSGLIQSWVGDALHCGYGSLSAQNF